MLSTPSFFQKIDKDIIKLKEFVFVKGDNSDDNLSDRKALFYVILLIVVNLSFLIISFLLIREYVKGDRPIYGSRIGAICKDGWVSSSTGSGACSHHGGVAKWRYKKIGYHKLNPGPYWYSLLSLGIVVTFFSSINSFFRFRSLYVFLNLVHFLIRIFLFFIIISLNLFILPIRIYQLMNENDKSKKG